MTSVPRDQVRLLTVDSMRETIEVGPFGSIERFVRAGDVVVVNDAATIPASLRAVTAQGDALEVRLFDPRADEWSAVLLGTGDWRTRTELRPAPPQVHEGQALTVGGLSARIIATAPQSPRLLRLRFEAPVDAVWRMVYQRGSPVQYAHRPDPEPLWAFQNIYASRPWAAEHVSAGRALTWQLLLGFRKAGARVVALTEGAGLSASGESKLDAVMPLPERYEIPPVTAAAVNAAVASNHRVIAVGTSVMRALESSEHEVIAGNGTTSLLIDGGHRRRVVSGLLTGIHSPQESHYRLLEALLPSALLSQASLIAREAGLQDHEAGDAMLVLAPTVPVVGHRVPAYQGAVEAPSIG